MAVVLPFKAVRPKKELAKEIAAPPYDVINSEEARQLAKGTPKSYLYISRPEIDLDPKIDEHDDKVYVQGKINYEKFKTNGWMFQDSKPCFYIYKQVMGNHSQIGLVAVASADDYDKGIIKKHEFTRPDKEDDRTRHITTINANTEPVFFTYPAVPAIDGIVNEWIKNTPEYDFTSDDGIKHILWVCDDQKVIDSIKSEFSKLKYMYVADGHHRSAAAWRLWKVRKAQNPKHTGNEEYNFFMTVIFPDNQMNIMAYNRVVKDLNGNSKEGFLKRLGQKFNISENGPDSPGVNLKFSMYLDHNWYLLTAKDGSYDAKDPVKRLDASILQDNLLQPILGIENPRTDKRINFVGGIRGTKELRKLVDSGKYAVAFSLHPVNIKQLISVADSGQVMPPKSTWFEPKLRSGLFVHQYD
jgi:uncharacterized protein (DUF1015 family)